MVVILMLAVVASPDHSPAVAQGPDAWTSYQLNMRTGPDTSYDVVAILDGNTGLIFEARNVDTSWLLGHTEDGAHRGWVSALYLQYQAGYSAFGLPVSDEIVSGPGAPADNPPPAEDNPQPPPAAPGGVGAYTVYDLNVRAGPGATYQVVDMAPANTGLVLEARNVDSSWVLGHSEDGNLRGWLASLYLEFVGVTASSLPVSDETVAGAGAEPVASVTYEGVDMGGYDPTRIQGIDLTAYPIVARPTARARDIFLAGRAEGRDPRAISKIGDCNTEHEYFLKHFHWNKYNLGDYTELQPVVDHFYESLGAASLAAKTGFLAGAVLDTMWSHPGYCEPDEQPLDCEYRVRNSSVSVIMFGTQDLLLMTPEQFDKYLRTVVFKTIEDNVIPILSTFPSNLDMWNKTIIYNQIVVRIALDYDIPLMNLWLALEELPNHGLDADGSHLSWPISGPAVFTPDNLQRGFPMRNLVTLQSLDAIWRGVMY